MTTRSGSRVLATIFLGLALFTAMRSGSAFAPSSLGARPLPTATVVSGLLVPVVAGVSPASAGEPPSVGEHWYWDLGFGSLHGETASIILLVFFLLVIFSLVGLGGSSKKGTM
mmetsp:Transcript_25239/g.69402  ORF Transcript_25239/g.69402 Transcript_25239/m.69402 type:complete len:113 (-) Transcript_25239:79-417(-)